MIGSFFKGLWRALERDDGPTPVGSSIDVWVEAELRRGIRLQEAGKLNEAADVYKAVIAKDGGAGGAYQLLSTVELSRGNLDRAEELIRLAIERRPLSVECLNTWGTILLASARHDEAQRLFLQALEIDPLALRPRSNLLFLSNLLQDLTREEIFELHREWARIHADPVTDGALGPENRVIKTDVRGRKIRIGYVSADLWAGHPIGHIMSAMLVRHDRNHFHVCCYNSTRTRDPLNMNLRNLVDSWCDVGELSDEAVASRILTDRIDVLIDLSGHTRHNRLGVFSRHPASVQVTWLGYLNTTGMHAMDWRIASRAGESADYQSYHSERLWLLDGLPWPWIGPSNDILKERSHHTGRPGNVLASFNAFHKLNQRVFEVWAQVLMELPETSMRIYGVPAGTCVDHVYEAFEAFEIDVGRIEVFGKLDYATYLRECLKADIALDPFPYNGGATTCECLWMGTPVVSLQGVQGFARSGASILSTIGFSDLVCSSVDEYKDVIGGIIRDANHPYRNRVLVQARARQALLRESDRFVPNFESAITEMLRQHARGLSS